MLYMKSLNKKTDSVNFSVVAFLSDLHILHVNRDASKWNDWYLYLYENYINIIVSRYKYNYIREIRSFGFLIQLKDEQDTYLVRFISS